MAIDRRELRVLVYGGGELGTAVAYRLWRAGLPVMVAERLEATAVCRALSLATAVHQGEVTVDGLVGRRADGILQGEDILSRGQIPVLVEPSEHMVERYSPQVLIDATQPRHAAPPFRLDAAPITVALGPGRVAGQDVAAVVDTSSLLTLGRVYEIGEAPAVSAESSGFHPVEVLTAPGNGVFVTSAQIGEAVEAGDIIGSVGQYPVEVPNDGHVRGLLTDGLMAYTGQPVAELWLGGEDTGCFTISPWARAVAGGALEAIVHLASERARD